jgi:hypothetical protein
MKRHIKIRHQGYSKFVTFADYVAGRISGLYRRNSQPTYESKKNMLLDTTDLINHATHEFFGELASGQAQKITFNGWKNQNQVQWPQIAAEQQNRLVSTDTNQGQFNCHNPFPYENNDGKDRIFGYRMANSEDSSNLDIRTVSFCQGQKSGRTETSSKHHDIVRDPNKSVVDKAITNRGMTTTSFNEKDGPLLMKRLVKQWTNGKSCYLLALKLSDGNHQKVQELIQIPNPKEPKQFITFKNSDEEHVDVTITNQKQEHWAIRAVENKITKMSEDDQDDFFRQIRHATFGVVRVHLVRSNLSNTPLSFALQQKPESIETYFMAITAEPAISERSCSVEKENENEKPGLSATTRNRAEMFLALRNDLVKLTSINHPVQSEIRQNIKF